MGIKTVPLSNIEEKTDNIYEAVVVMSGQAKRVLDERIVQESIKDAEEEDYGVFDEIEEKSPEDYIELEKITSVAIRQFMDGDVKWSKKEKIL
jgi:predicted FMN-binding regulatory protein PaiB